jgi:hypothetical protein
VPVTCLHSADADADAGVGVGVGGGQVTAAPPIEDCLLPFPLSCGSSAVVQGATLSTSFELISSRTDFRSLHIGSSGLNDIVLQVWVPL